MNTQVMFYQLNDPRFNREQQLQALHVHACFQAAYFYRQNQRVFIYAQDQSQAHEIDELLWSFDPDSFVPHNLIGEGPANGSPVEISWQPPRNRRPILINLTNAVPAFANQFSFIVDFVPENESLKVAARERYKHYKQLGFDVQHQKVISEQQSTATTN